MNGEFKNGKLRALQFFGNINYEGPFDDKVLPHGKGQLKWSGGVARGEWIHGIPINMDIVFANGDKYAGNVDAEYRPHGRGIYCFKDGEVFSGEYKNGERV